MAAIKDGKKYNGQDTQCVIREIFNQKDSNLDFLSAAEMEILNSRSMSMCYKHEEIMIVNLRGPVTAVVEDTEYKLDHYDMLYIPLETSFYIDHEDEEPAWLYMYRATGEKKYEVYHAEYEKVKQDDERIRHLERKVVYKMFDTSENANKFMVGYTFYEDRARAYPPHNHTDQEEVYSFIEGYGAMEVYEDEKNKTFVKAVDIGDHITIPVLNYHPVFSHEEPLCFIWCIAGERYWVGDKNKDFMDASVDKLTT